MQTSMRMTDVQTFNMKISDTIGRLTYPIYKKGIVLFEIGNKLEPNR